jgi:branched-chain amino acid transport system substrate-binding protein
MMILAVACLTLTGVTACGTAAGSTNGTVVVGAPVAETGPGSAVGTYTVRGLKLAGTYVNENATDLIGPEHKIEFKFSDTTSAPPQALAQTRSLVADQQVVALIGPTISPEVQAVAPFAQQSKIVALAPSANYDGITDAGDYVFAPALTPKQYTATVVEAAAKLGIKSVGVIYATDNAATKAQGPLAVSEFEKRGINTTSVGVLTTDASFTSAVTKLQAAGAKVVFLALYPDQVVAFLRQAAQLGYKPQIVGPPLLGTPQIAKGAEGADIGNIFASDYNPVLDTPANQWFVSNYKKEYGEAPDMYTAQAFSAGLVMAQAIKAVKGSVTRDAIKDALAGLHDAVTVLGDGKLTFSHSRQSGFDAPLLQVKPDHSIDAYRG